MVILFSCCHFLPAHSQDEWKWANYWTGNDDPLNTSHSYNYVVRTAFDDDGNVYVFGSFGGNARVYDQTMSTWISDMVEVVAANTQGTVLMKFDSSGNFLWSRLVKNTKQGECPPYDMVLRDGKIIISGAYMFDYSSNEKLWFLDTLITQQTAMSYPAEEYHPPYTFTGGIYTFFSVLDLDGNILENHFVKTLSRAQENRHTEGLSARFGATPMTMDSYGNIYLAAAICYQGPDTLPWTVVIDEDSAKTYDIFLPGSTDAYGSITNMMIFKFSPGFDLLKTTLGVDHTVGLSPYMPVDTVNPFYVPYVFGLNVDGEDNLYLSGYLRDMSIMDEYNQYPMSIYWDSTHYATVDNGGMAWCMPFIIKYDSDGNVQWSNQAHVNNDLTTTNHFMDWSDNYVDNSGVYLMGKASIMPGESPLFYFDNESNHLTYISGAYQHTGYFVRFDKETGAFKSLGQLPGMHVFASERSRPAVVNNHLLGLFLHDFSSGSSLGYFHTNGQFMRADSITYSDPSAKVQKTILGEGGRILCDLTCKEDLSFGHDLSLTFDNHLYSHAVVAYRYDPSILTPYPEDSTGVAQHAESSPVRLYPNPTGGVLHVESKGTPIDRVYVLDLAGKELLRRDLHGNRGEIDVSSLPNGMYVLRTVCGGETHVEKFVKTDL